VAGVIVTPSVDVVSVKVSAGFGQIYVRAVGIAVAVDVVGGRAWPGREVAPVIYAFVVERFAAHRTASGCRRQRGSVLVAQSVASEMEGRGTVLGVVIACAGVEKTGTQSARAAVMQRGRVPVTFSVHRVGAVEVGRVADSEVGDEVAVGVVALGLCPAAVGSVIALASNRVVT